jgi:hypothetical protein
VPFPEVAPASLALSAEPDGGDRHDEPEFLL